MAVITGLVGFGLGFLANPGTDAAEVAAPLSSAPSTPAPLPTGTEPSAQSAEPTAAGCPSEDDIDAMRAELTWLRGVVDPLSGPPPEWPDRAGFQPDAVREAVQSAFPGTDISLDCREFPCIAVVETSPEVPEPLATDLAEHGVPLEAYGRVGEHVERTGLTDVAMAVRSNALEDGSYRILVAWGTKEQDEAHAERVGARFELLAEHGYREE